VILPANHQPTKPMQPSKESLHGPASTVTAKRASILRDPLAIAFVGSDQLDVVGSQQIGIQRVAIIGRVADQSFREFVEKALCEGFFDELAFMRRSTLDTNGERKTVIIGDGDNLGPFAAPGRPNREPPFFAPVKEASIWRDDRCRPHLRWCGADWLCHCDSQLARSPAQKSGMRIGV